MGKDGSWKGYFEDPARYADAINGFGCGGEQKVKAEDLQEIDTQIKGIKVPKFVNSFASGRNLRRAKFRDMARKVAFGVNFAIIGIESQETIDYAIPLRNAYDVVANYANVSGLIAAKEYCIEDGGKMNMCTAIKEMMEDSRMEGLLEGKLGGFVEALQLVGQTKEAIISKVSEEFGLDLQEATENVEKYLK